MTDNESPKLEAVANLSPVSPRPLHNTYTLPQVLPELQDRAEDPDVVPLEPSTFRTAAAAMAPNPDPDPPLQGLDAAAAAAAAAVEGSPDSDGNDAQSQDVSIADDDSFDAYDEDGSGQEQEHQQQEESAGLEPENDDYARTFDSPKEQAEVADEEGEAQQPQHEDVTETPESMNISEQLAGVPEQSAAQIVSADPTAPGVPAQDASQPSHTADPAQDALVPPESDHQPAPAPAVVQEALPHASASEHPSLPQQSQQSVSSPDPDKVDPDKLDKAAPSEEQPGVQPDEDVDMNAGGDSDATAIDIQKLVDEITAKAEAEASSEQPPAKPSAPAPAPASAPLQTQSPPSMDVDQPSLPPKPALTQEQSQQTYSQATYHHGSLPNAPPYSSAPPASPSQPAFGGVTNGAPGAHMSQPPTYNPTPPFASYPNAYPPGTAPSQAPANNGAGLQQTYDEFLADERKHMSEAKWERFPDGSRIFIGE